MLFYENQRAENSLKSRWVRIIYTRAAYAITQLLSNC